MNELTYSQEELLCKLKDLNFSITELTLYLDTHPTDKNAVSLHNQYCNSYRKLADSYQKVYGPLTSMCPCNKWRWIESPWPWEGEGY